MSGQPVKETLVFLLNLSRNHFVSMSLSSILTPLSDKTDLKAAKDRARTAYDHWRGHRSSAEAKQAYRTAFREVYSILKHNLDLTPSQIIDLHDFETKFQLLQQAHDAKHMKTMLGYGPGQRKAKVPPQISEASLATKTEVRVSQKIDLDAEAAKLEQANKTNAFVRFFVAIWQAIVWFFRGPSEKVYIPDNTRTKLSGSYRQPTSEMFNTGAVQMTTMNSVDSNDTHRKDPAYQANLAAIQKETYRAALKPVPTPVASQAG